MKPDFSNSSVLVIGDVMIDKYFTGSVKRISPEAPVPVIQVKEKRYVPGGAANVVNNLSQLKSESILLGAVGADENRDHLLEIFRSLSIKHDLVESANPTITKMRIIGNHQQIARLDFEEDSPLDETAVNLLKKNFDKIITDYNLVIISDYGKGLCTPDLCRYIINKCNDLGKKVIVDPKKKEWDKYKGAFLITPNVKELGEICGEDIANTNDDIARQGANILQQYQLTNILVTRSEKGMTLINNDGVVHIPTAAREVYDVSGAGDTVVAALAAAISSGYSLEESVRLANKAAGIAVSKFGTAPVSIEELHQSLTGFSDRKILDLNQLTIELKKKRDSGKKIVFTNGCFDILHRGHVAYLKEARSLGDLLIIGLNTDESVRRLKGPERPINNENDRAELLAALECVDYVILFNEETPRDLIAQIRPDFLVKGGDYTPESVVGREFANETVIINFVNGYSTTATINKIQKKK